jgi:hypothetical protein
MGPPEAFLSMASAFLTRSPEWDAAENAIKVERAKRCKVVDTGAPALQKAAEFEIEFVYCLWNGQYNKAYDAADAVLGCLSGGEEMRAYQCFWQHQAAVAAFLHWKQASHDPFRNLAVERLNKAAKGNFGIHWLTTLAGKLGAIAELPDEAVPEDWISGIGKLLAELKFVGSQFDRTLAEKRGFIQATDAKKFHQGLAFLGRMLGATSNEFEGDAKPDGLWRFGLLDGFVFEAKTQDGIPPKEWTLLSWPERKEVDENQPSRKSAWKRSQRVHGGIQAVGGDALAGERKFGANNRRRVRGQAVEFA